MSIKKGGESPLSFKIGNLISYVNIPQQMQNCQSIFDTVIFVFRKRLRDNDIKSSAIIVQ